MCRGPAAGVLLAGLGAVRRLGRPGCSEPGREAGDEARQVTGSQSREGLVGHCIIS